MNLRFPRLRPFSAPLRLALALASSSFLTACAHLPDRPASALPPYQPSTPAPAILAQSSTLALELAALGPDVRPEEAAQVAACATDYPQALARAYRVVKPALLHNALVNCGLKERGLCYQWAEDLLAQLQTLPLSTLQLHWGMARASTWREHNCIVVTARGQPFADGIVLDAWRRSGQLVWSHLRADHYPWIEGELAGPPPPPLAAPPQPLRVVPLSLATPQ